MRDPGLQPERTALAWSRTALLVAANAVLMLRAGLQSDNRWLIGLCAVFFLAAAGFAGVARCRRQDADLPAGPQAPSRHHLAMVSLVTCALAVAAVWVLSDAGGAATPQRNATVQHST